MTRLLTDDEVDRQLSDLAGWSKVDGEPAITTTTELDDFVGRSRTSTRSATWPRRRVTIPTSTSAGTRSTLTLSTALSRRPDPGRLRAGAPDRPASPSPDHLGGAAGLDRELALPEGLQAAPIRAGSVLAAYVFPLRSGDLSSSVTLIHPKSAFGRWKSATLGELATFHIATRHSVLLERLRRRAGADQVAVAEAAVDPADRRPVLVDALGVRSGRRAARPGRRRAGGSTGASHSSAVTWAWVCGALTSGLSSAGHSPASTLAISARMAIIASQNRSSSARFSDSVGSTIRVPATGKLIVGAWKP